MLTLRASGDLNINASISDGFVQLSNPLGLQAPRARSFEQVQALFEVLGRAYPALADSIEARKASPAMARQRRTRRLPSTTGFTSNT